MACPNAGCIDVTASAQNCGACGVACATGKHCAAGKCECAVGQMACGDACADLMTDRTHCGSCEQTCAADGTCNAGHCAGADGCFGPAGDISLSQLIIYQTVAIPVMKDQAEVNTAMRNSDVVAGRETLLRVLVTPGPGWSAHEISVRVHLSDDTGPLKDVFVKATPKAASTEGELASSFNLQLPKDVVKPGLRYSVELAECGAATGTAMAPRFPATGDLALGAKTTGVMKIHFVPVQVGNKMPDTSDARLGYYKLFFEALYPITELQWSLGDVYQGGQNDPNFDNLLDDMRDFRVKEQPADDVYYVALSPVASSDGFADGIGFQAEPDEADYRVAITTSSDDAEYSSLVIGHEVGHNQGLPHSPGCDPDGPDPMYPYKGGFLGSWGYDHRHADKLIDPKKTYDIMSYCTPIWFSDYTYEKVVKRVAHVNGNDLHRTKGPVATSDWRVLLAAADGTARWGHPYRGRTPARPAEPGTVYDALGQAVANVNVYRIPTSSGRATSLVMPAPAPGWFSVQVRGLPPVRF
jgi:hypothetical protein